jgi:hypothetical protein
VQYRFDIYFPIIFKIGSDIFKSSIDFTISNSQYHISAENSGDWCNRSARRLCCTRLLSSGKFSVRALVPTIDAPASQNLELQGATLVQGDWDDNPAIEEAVVGCTGLFLKSYPSFTDPIAEFRQGIKYSHVFQGRWSQARNLQ